MQLTKMCDRCAKQTEANIKQAEVPQLLLITANPFVHISCFVQRLYQQHYLHIMLELARAAPLSV